MRQKAEAPGAPPHVHRPVSQPSHRDGGQHSISVAGIEGSLPDGATSFNLVCLEAGLGVAP